MKRRIQMIAGVIALSGIGLFAIPSIPGSPVMNTGVASGAGCIGTVTLTAGCTLAAHAGAVTGWTITAAPAGSSTTAVAITSAGGSPAADIWLPDNTTSRWLRPANGTSPFNGNDTDPTGFYTWSQSFTLTAGEASSGFFTGRFASDDQGFMSVNGIAIAATPTGAPSYNTWTPFTIDAGLLQAGVNTLTVRVRNATGTSAVRAATGLRVEFASVSLPEGGEIAVLTIALGVGLILWSRKKQTAVPVV